MIFILDYNYFKITTSLYDYVDDYIHNYMNM